MAGKKGRSGRRPLSVEMKRLATIDKAWDLLHDTIQDKAINIERRIDVAKTLAAKDMPTKVSGDADNPITIKVVNFGNNCS